MKLGTARTENGPSNRAEINSTRSLQMDGSAEVPAAAARGGAPEATVATVSKPKPLRTLWQKVKWVTKGWRLAAMQRTPPWARRIFGPLVWYIDMLVIDHGIFRLFYVNRHRVGDQAWRSAQPAPHHIRALKR